MTTVGALLELCRRRDLSTVTQRHRLADRLPTQPGVYAFRSAAGEVLYVGKAKSLRRRVRDYFRPDPGRSPRIARMLREAVDLEVDGWPLALTVSAGVAAFPEVHVKTPSELLLLADGALYEAKNRGRNRCLLDLGRGRYRAAAIQEGAQAYLTRQYSTIAVVGALVFVIIGLLLGLLIFASFSLNAHSNDFIVVGLFDYAFHGWAKRGRDLLVLAVSAAALGFLGWRMWTLGDLFYASSQPGKYFDIKMWPFAYAFAALGVLLGSILPTARAAQGVGLLCFFGLFFIAGGGPPPALLPDAIDTFARMSPMGPLVAVIRDPWHGDGWNIAALVALAALAGVAWATAVRLTNRT